ncbi:hypothetical protein AVEN_165970-1, partial [Araneus ventricosus]
MGSSTSSFRSAFAMSNGLDPTAHK